MAVIGMLFGLYAGLNLLTVFIDAIPKVLSSAQNPLAPVGLPRKEVDGLLIAAGVAIVECVICFSLG